MIEWQPYAAALAAELTAAGVLSPGWREAFEQVPRHEFVPEFFTLDGERFAADLPERHDRWLADVYSDTSLTTKLLTAPGTDLAWPVSSSTRPSLMARMLALLEVGDGQRVLEIGTGTGYNAALLSWRAGDANVTSLDIDSELVQAAGRRLAELGYRPTLIAADGANGAPGRAPFDRIIATCAVPAIPSAWIAQLDKGGLIVADVRGELNSSLVVARKDSPRSVTGRFLASPGHFMWLRAAADNPLRSGGRLGGVYDFTDPETATTAMPLTAFDDGNFRFLLQLAVPGLGPIGDTTHDGRDGFFLTAQDDKSWVEINLSPDDVSTVRYGGPHSLWPAIADVWQLWNELGRPKIDRFGLTSYDDGRYRAWLDHPGQTVYARF